MEGRCVEKASCTTCHGTREEEEEEEEEEEVPSGALVHLGPADPSERFVNGAPSEIIKAIAAPRKSRWKS